MQNNNKVCHCNNILVKDVLDYVKKNQKKTSICEKLSDLRIGTKCKGCLNENFKGIDTHYSKIFK